MVISPGEVRVLRIGAASKNLAFPLHEFAVLVAELYNLCWTYKCEIERPEKDYLPQVGVGRIRDGLKLFAAFG
jgi:hypothetical protein